MATKNGRENERKWRERRSQAGELEASPVTLLIEVDSVIQGLTEAYVRSEPREITKQTKIKAITRVKIGKNQKQMQIGHGVKSRNGQQEEQC